MRAAVLVAVLLAAGSARGDSDVETAKRLYEAGRQAHETGNYVAAIASFEGALRLSPRPSVFFATAQAYRRQYFIDGDKAKLRRAIDLYRRYVEEVKQGERRDEAARHLGDLEILAAKLPSEAAPPAPAPALGAPTGAPTLLSVYAVKNRKDVRVSIDGGPLTPLPLFLEVTPGKHRVHAEAPGYDPFDTEVLVAEGGQLPVPVSLDPRPAQLTVVAPEGARIYIDDHEVGIAPLAGPLRLAAGAYQLTVRQKGHKPFQEVLRLRHGDVRRLAVELAITTRRKIAFGSLIGAGTCSFAVIYLSFFVGAHTSEAEDLRDKLMASGLTEAEAGELNHHVDLADRGIFATNLALLGMAVGLAAGSWLYFADDPAVDLRPSMIITPQIGRDTAGASMTLRF